MAATTEMNLKFEIEGLCQRYWSERRNKKDTVEQDGTSLQVKNYKLKPTSDAPAGFLGRHQLLKADVLIKDRKGIEKIEKLCFFTKSAPSDVESHMNYVDGFGVFKKEILVYREILPKLEEIFGGMAPKCYYADNNLLVFENLAEQGYKMGAGRDGLLNYEHLKSCLTALAAMHAGSIVHEVRQGKKLNEMYPDALFENAYPTNTAPDHVRVQNFNRAVEVIMEIIKLLPKYQKNLNYILNTLHKRMSVTFEMSKPSTKYQNVFTHGDLWANNIMFQYGKFGEIPIQTRFVDFQLARYAPAMLDLITVLTIPTSRAFRELYLTELLADYYRFMTEFLRRENLSIADFIPKAQYDASFKEFRIYGLIESCLFSHITMLPPELTQKLTGSADGFSDFFERKRIEICMEAYKTDKIYFERLNDMIEDLVDNYVLQEI